MDRLAIINCSVITPERIIPSSNVIVENGIIVGIHACLDWESFYGKIIDGKGCYLSPGFVDIHSHGRSGHDFLDGDLQGFIKTCEFHAQHGTTSILPTVVTGDDEELKQVFHVYHQVRKTKYQGAQILGIHLEGPFFSVEYKGAQDESYIRNPTPEHYKRIYEWSEWCIRRWSAAPELPGIDKFGEFLQRNNILASIAHTGATYEQVLSAYENGFCLITHLYSAMSTIRRVNGFRIAGVVESAYFIDGMRAELIADGCHLPPELLKLAYKFKGAENLVLVTDSMRGAGMGEGKSILGSLKHGQQVYIENGVAYMPDRSAFAGSVCTADRLVRTMYQQAGVPLCDAVKMMTSTPARVIGFFDRKGSITIGKDADLVLFDENISIRLCMVNGRIIFNAER